MSPSERAPSVCPKTAQEPTPHSILHAHQRAQNAIFRSNREKASTFEAAQSSAFCTTMPAALAIEAIGTLSSTMGKAYDRSASDGGGQVLAWQRAEDEAAKEGCTATMCGWRSRAWACCWRVRACCACWRQGEVGGHVHARAVHAAQAGQAVQAHLRPPKSQEVYEASRGSRGGGG